MSDLASVIPCQVPYAGLLQLLILAELDDTHVSHVIAEARADIVTVDPVGFLNAIAVARTTR